MWAASPDSNGGLDEETLDALREALSIAFQNRGTAVNQRDRIRSNGGRRGRNPGAETGPGTRTNPIDLTATTSSSSSPGSRVFRSLGASGRRDGRDGRDGRENDRFRCSGRASRSATGSGFRSADTGMNRSSESGSFKEFLDSNGEASENLRSDEQEDSESTSSESPFTAGIQYSTAAMYTNEEESSLETRDGQEEFISTNGNLPGALCSYQGESLRTRNGQDERATGVGSSLAGTLSNGEESVRTPDEGILVNVNSLAAMWSDGEEGFELADEVAETILRKHSPAVIETNKESLGIPCDGEAGVLVHGNTPAAKWSAGEQSLEAPDDQVENILTTGHLTEARGVNEEGVLEISEDEDLQRGELGWLNGRSMDSEDACSLGSDMEPDFLREDPEHHSQANHRTRPSRLPASQAMRPLMSVVIPVRTKKRTRQEDSEFNSEAKMPVSRRKQNSRATSPLLEQAKALSDPTPHVEEKRPTRIKIHDERGPRSQAAEAARAEKCREAAEAFAYLDALPTMTLTQPSFDPFADLIICKH